jgi:hypothetical protein
MIECFIFLMFFCLDAKEPKDQGFSIKAKIQRMALQRTKAKARQ